MILFILTTWRPCAFIIAHIPHPSHYSCWASQCQVTHQLVTKGVDTCHQVAVTTCFQADTSMLCNSGTSAPYGTPCGFWKWAWNSGMGAVQQNYPQSLPVKASQWHSSRFILNCREVWKAILSAATKAKQTTAKQIIAYNNFLVNKCSTHSLYGPLIQQYYRETAIMHKTS